MDGPQRKARFCNISRRRQLQIWYSLNRPIKYPNQRWYSSVYGFWLYTWQSPWTGHFRPRQCQVSSADHMSTEWITIEIDGGSQVKKIYHPPSTNLRVGRLPPVQGQFVLSIDINYRHESWGYPDSSNSKGELLADFASNNNLETLFDPKQSASFHSVL